ncbi:hypothetical protein ScPMuIL_001985 [Solemya velum]
MYQTVTADEMAGQEATLNQSLFSYVEVYSYNVLFNRKDGRHLISYSCPCAGFPPVVMQFLGATSSYWRDLLCRQFKPFLMGKINYAPDTPAVRKIINKVDMFLQQGTYLSLCRRLKLLSETLELVLILSMPGLCNLLEGQLRTQAGIDQSICDRLNNFFTSTNGSYDWMDALNGTENTLDMIGQLASFFTLSFKGYPSESDLLKDSLKQINNYTFLAAVVFEGEINDTLPSFIKYKIRMDTEKVDSTRKIMDKYWRPGPRDNVPLDTKYTTYGFAYIQDLIDHAIIQEQTGLGDTGVVLQQFPYPCYIRDRFVFAISRTLPLFMVLAWVLSVAMLCKSIVYEKELRLKEVMKIMGLDNGIHWIAWFINAFILMFATTVLLVIIFKYGKILEYSDPTVILLFLTLFTMATIAQCFLISVFFSKANLAACCAGFIYFLLYLPYTLVVQWEDEMTLSRRLAASLSSSVAFGYGCSYLAQFEEMTEGIQWHNMASSPSVDDDFNMALVLVMMVVDTIIYLLFMWYIEAVFPGQYGIPRKWYFFIQKSYWCGITPHNFEAGSPQLNDYATYELNSKDKINIETEPSDRALGVAIRNLKKVYKSGKKVAVDGLSMNFYEGQITSFLGHNGAGKTTTMSILTGLFPPTEGTGYIYGRDIRTDMNEIRHSLGMCPQHNVLFDLLTVEEHLWFYARLKGQNEKKVREEMEKMIKNVNLPLKRKELSRNLSGGMKRKLSVAIAFVGGSQTVILDEPTAGVDPYARRAIWDLLLKLKKDRTIIMSTHHMDEADILGDRIAIISHGKLCCCGSSLFLKTKFGSGYYLTLVKDDGTTDQMLNIASSVLSSRPTSSSSVRTIVDVEPIVNDDDEGFAESTRSDSDPSSKPPTPTEGRTMIKGFSESRVTAFIQKFVPGARYIEDNGIEICFQLPETSTASFTPLFKGLEMSYADLGISSYGISDTSLEEVFLKVADNTNVDVDEELEKGLETFSEGGRFPRSTERSSLRKSKRHAKVARRSSKVDTIDLLDSESLTGSMVSIPVSEGESVGDTFTHPERKRQEGWKLVMRQFFALIIKRFHRIKRSKKEFFCEVVMPAGFILLAMIFAMITPPYKEEPPLELQPWIYVPTKGDPHLSMFYSNDAPNSLKDAKFENVLQTKSGVGNRCLKPETYQINDYPCVPQPTDKKWTASRFHNGTDCSCSTGFQVCPAGAAGSPPPSKLISTTDFLLNMTARNLSDWILKTNREFRKRRYGGLSFGKVQMEMNVNLTIIQESLQRLSTAANNGRPVINGNEDFWDDLADLITDLQPKSNYAKVWYNNKGWISSVAYMNIMNNLILRSTLPPGKDPETYGISTVNHPMEFTRAQLEQKIESSFVDVVIAMCVIFAMSFIPASLVMFLIEDKESNSKHLQFVSGVNPTMYWVANFIWDMLNYLIPSILFIFIFLAFGREAYISTTNGPCLVLLLFLYGFAMIPLMYPFSRLFSVPSTALVVLMSINVFLGTVSTLSTFILELMEAEDETLADINVILKQVFLILPQYCLGRGLLDMSKNQLYADAYESLGGFPTTSPFEWEQVGRNLLSLFVQGLIFFTLNWLIEYEFFIKSRLVYIRSKPSGTKIDDEDIDVKKEQRRVLSGDARTDVLRFENLTKVYKSRSGSGKQTAVDRLCLGVPNGQCFGLLGVNGAGKTTTFKMLTGDTHVSRGEAFVSGHSILKDMVKVRQQIGYCPQFDAVEPLLTGKEQLYFYARLRGIPESDLKEVAEWGIKKMGLIKYADKLVGTYSGGNKRKLSTAISLIGNPPVIFLDEPTTGMDPSARRFLWDRILDIVKEGRSVILTSHSMEECEALCGRLAIMVNGRFRCLGSVQHLKNRFGSGYTVILHVSGEKPDLQSVKDYMTATFPGAVLKDSHHNMLQYQLNQTIKLSGIFGHIECVRDELCIEYYSVSQTTLDQVFINFAKLQTDLLDEELDELPDDLKIYEAQMMEDLDEGRESNVIQFEQQSITGSTVNLVQPASEGGPVRIHLPTFTSVST